MSAMPRHRVLTASTSNKRLHGLLNDVCPQALTCAAIADRARELANQTTPPPPNPWPTSADDITDTWITNEVERRRLTAEAKHQQDALADLRFNATQDAIEAVEEHSVDLIKALAAQFDTLLDQLADEVAKLGDARTAGEAIAAGPEATAAWKKIATQLLGEYHDIRHAQSVLYRGCDTLNFDELRCGDGNPAITDPEARVYRLRNIATIAPNWRGSSGSDGTGQYAQYPWPTDPAEKLVWIVSVDSGLWLPTPAELREFLSHGPAETLPQYAARLLKEPA